MALEIYLNFNGNCSEAVEFYSDVFGAEKQPIMTYGDSHPETDFEIHQEAKNLVMHTFLMICGSKVMFADAYPGMPFIQGNNISLTIVTKDRAEVESVFNKLKEGGKVEMELQETFWSKCYGYLVDKFGIGWQLSLDSE